MENISQLPNEKSVVKHPFKQCNSPLNISSISLETCEIFLQSYVITSNPVIFLQIFNFTLITCHSNRTLFWHAATIHAVFSLMTGL